MFIFFSLHTNQLTAGPSVVGYWVRARSVYGCLLFVYFNVTLLFICFLVPPVMGYASHVPHPDVFTNI